MRARIKSRGPIHPDSPIPDRLATLEANFKEIDKDLDAAYGEMDKRADEMNTKIKAECKERDQSVLDFCATFQQKILEFCCYRPANYIVIILCNLDSCRNAIAKIATYEDLDKHQVVDSAAQLVVALECKVLE